MSNDVLITPASRKIEFKDSSANVDAKIETDASGNLLITNTGGDISIGDTSSDIFVGDGTNNIDIVFEQDGEIRGTSGVTITLGQSDSSIRMATDLNLNSNDITNVGDLTVTGNLTITGDINSYNVTDLDVSDKTITLGVGQTEANSGSSGIIIDGSAASMLWDEGDNRFEFNKNIYAPVIYGSGAGITSLNGSNISSGTVAAARIANLDTSKITSGLLGGARIATGTSGDWWSGNAVKVGTDGVMEIGKYIDFHNADAGTSDYTARITNTGDHLYATGRVYVNANQRVFADDYHPNADTLTTARTISLGGDVTGSASFNGSSNITITAAVVNDSHNHNHSDGAFTVNGLLQAGAGSNHISTASAPFRWQRSSSSQTGQDDNVSVYVDDSNIYFTHNNDADGDASSYNFRYMTGGTASNLLIFSASAISWKGQNIFRDDYHPNADTLTTARTIAGTSFNGSANIDINYNNLTNKPTIPSVSGLAPIASPTFTGTVTTPNLTIGSGNKIKFANNDYIRYDDTANRFHFDADGGSSNASVQAVTFAGALSGNATTATTLATARTINGVSFNGSANITVADSTKLPLAGGTITSGTSTGLTINHNSFANGLVIERNDSANAAAIKFKNTSGESGILYASHSNKSPYWRNGGTASDYRIFHDNYHPNADTLTTARTISLGGDVTGSVSFNGSSNVTITTTVNDDSHFHHRLDSTDDRDMKPNTSGIATSVQALKPFFSSYGGMTGTANTTYVDVLAFDTYGDSSGGGPSAITFKKGNSAGNPEMHIWKAGWNATTWSTGQRVFADNYHPNADTLTTARTIGGVSFNGSANINLPGVNTAGNQNTSGTAAGLSGTPNITVGTITSSTIQVQHSGTNNISLSPTSTGGVINARNSSGTSVAVMDGRGTPFIDVTGNLKTGGTTRIDSSGNLSNIGTISSGALTATTTADATPALIATNSGGVGSVIARFIGDTDGLEIQCGQGGNSGAGTGDYALLNTQQDNGLVFFDGSGGVDVLYNGAVVQSWDSTGGTKLISGTLQIPTKIEHSGDTDTYLQFDTDRIRLFAGGTAKFDSNTTYLTGNQTITLSGDVSGSGTTSIAVTVADDSHNHVISNVDGLQTALDAKEPSNATILHQGSDISTADWNTFIDGTEASWNTVVNHSGSNRPVGSYTYGTALSFSKSGQAKFQLYASEQASAGVNKGLYYRTGWNTTYRAWANLWDSANDGSGSGLDADTVDGIQGGSFLRSDAADTATGSIAFSGATQYFRRNDTTNYTNAPLIVESYGGSSTTTGIGFHISGQLGRYLRMNSSGVLAWEGSTIWHAGNDGSGSGLDADLLDGLQGTQYIRKIRSRIHSADSTSMDTTLLNSTEQGFNYGTSSGVTGPYLTFGGLGSGIGNYQCQLNAAYSSGGSLFKFRTRNDDTASWNSWYTLWHSGNDGSGSGLDADLLDGYQLNTGRSNVANRVVATDSNGYIQAGWINSTSGATASTLTRIYCSQDGYIRYQTPANFGVSISPHINYNTIANTPTIPTNNNQLTNGAGYLTSSSTQSKYLRSDTSDQHTSGQITFNGGIHIGSTNTYIVQHVTNGLGFRVGTGNYYGLKIDPTAGHTETIKTGVGGAFNALQGVLQVKGDQTMNRGSIIRWANDGGGTGEYIHSKAASPYDVCIHSGGYDGIQVPNTGSVRINHNGAQKFVTTSTGVSITGALVASGDITAYSDRKKKKNIRDLESASKYLNAINPKRFAWKDTEKEDIGFIAQDVEEAGLSEFVSDSPEYNTETALEEGTVKTLDYGKMVSVLWGAVKEQQETINKLTDRINDLEKGE